MDGYKDTKWYKAIVERFTKSPPQFNPRHEFAARLRDAGMTFDAMQFELADYQVTRERARQLTFHGYAQRETLGPDVCAAEYAKNPFNPQDQNGS